MALGEVVAEARRKAKRSQKELAALIKREDGKAISPQYLNDIEHNRRNAPAHLIEQFARILEVPADLLYYWAGSLPKDLRSPDAEDSRIIAAFGAFRRQFRGSG
jgi:transcriptional regulator with XRE-family HTH domain